MKSKIFSLMLSTVLAVSIITGCGNSSAKESTDASSGDNNLFMVVKSFDEKTLTGDLYHEEKIKKEDVEKATEGSVLTSVNGTEFTAVSFAEVNNAFGYGTDEDFKRDTVGISRFDKFLVKCSDDDSYYALEQFGADKDYTVVMPLNEGNLRKLVESNVTYKIKDDCEIKLQKFVNDGEFDNLEQEIIIGKDFKGDNYPGWAPDAKEYYMTTEMLVRIEVSGDELTKVTQIYVP